MVLPAVLTDRLRLPVIAAPMFLVSTPALVIAECTAGVIGSFPALNARPQTQLDEWLHEITETLAAWDRDHPDEPAAPFAVNQIVHGSNPRWEDDVATCGRWEVPIIISSLGARDDLNHTVHAWGGITLHDVINDRFARKAIQKGADGLIAVAAGAGGHAGQQSPFALVQEIRPGSTVRSCCRGPSPPDARSSPRRRSVPIWPTSVRRSSPPLKRTRPTATSRRSSMPRPATSSTATSSQGCTATTCDPRSPQPASTPTTCRPAIARSMDFAAEETADTKAWRDVWGSGQGVGVITAVEPAGERIARLRDEYRTARTTLAAQLA